ncbi:MAG: D-glycero-alpha-D-manno-heptose-1,7-bisphosphate 7-phosphatase [Opitutales bacterium]
MTKALFLDRDGTLIFDKDYLADPAQVELLPGVPAALRRAQALGYRLFLFTNQSGIGRGFNTLEQVLACNRRMLELLGLGDALFTDVCIAPEAPDQPSHYRKPSPNFILESIARHALTPTDCWMIGDRDTDVQAGLNAGIHAVAVCTGKYDETGWRARLPAPAFLFPDLAAFVATLK